MEWYIPITILPGVSLLVLSTINLIISLNEELKQLNKDRSLYLEIIELKLKQLKVLSYALIALYISLFSMVVSGILGSLLTSNQSISITVLLIGTLILSLAITLLISYSIKSLSIRQKHLKIN